MSSLNDYVARLTSNGATKRERDLSNLKRELTKKAVNSLSCKDVMIADESRKLIIDSGTTPNKKIIKSLPDESFFAGQYVTFADNTWLIVNADCDDKVYTDGNMSRCNWTLKWQDETLAIVERECVVQSASQYNTGVEENKTVKIGSNQLMLTLPLDSDTCKLLNDKRMFISRNTVNPKPYILTRIDDVPDSFGDGTGIITWVVTEDPYNPVTDNIDLMICDYTSPAPTPPTPTNIEIIYAGQPQIRCGGSIKTFTANTENEITIWSKVCTADQEDYIVLTPDADDSKKCKVKCLANDLLIGSSFRLQCTDGTNNGDLLVTIVGGI